MLSSRFIPATVLLICLHVTFVSPSPARSQSVHGPSLADESQGLQPRQAIPADNSVYHLPPVAEVFRMVAAAESGNAPPVAPPIHNPTPMVAAALTTAPTTTTPAPPNPTYHQGPGPLVPTSVADPEAKPPMNSAVPSVPQATANGPAENSSPPARKLTVLGVVMGGLMVLLLLVYAFVNRRVFAACSRRKKTDPEKKWTKVASPPLPPPSFRDSAKDALYVPPWSQKFASSWSSEVSQDSSTGLQTPPLGAMVPHETKVLDITSGYPRSKFSVTSSDYPYSLISSARTSGPMLPSADGQHTADSPLLPAYEFFNLPSNPESFDDNHHSRAHSVPVFGHAASREFPDVMVRSGEHRRSRSVSGLAYVVKPPQRESGSSAGDWRGDPQSDHGWPSAH
ncbi:hypothetical protein FPV67DRAFT_1668911 [Lyophyllum atratum]|nr:hypothetical protein FPV67DRAFT_1668911 [Lyophyllum atratum]